MGIGRSRHPSPCYGNYGTERGGGGSSLPKGCSEGILKITIVREIVRKVALNSQVTRVSVLARNQAQYPDPSRPKGVKQPVVARSEAVDSLEGDQLPLQIGRASCRERV